DAQHGSAGGVKHGIVSRTGGDPEGLMPAKSRRSGGSRELFPVTGKPEKVAAPAAPATLRGNSSARVRGLGGFQGVLHQGGDRHRPYPAGDRGDPAGPLRRFGEADV